MIAFYYVVLIDTDCVNPYQERTLRGSNMPYSGGQVVHGFESRFNMDQLGVRRLEQCFVLMRLYKCLTRP
jgi:hypothetical protein